MAHSSESVCRQDRTPRYGSDDEARDGPFRHVERPRSENLTLHRKRTDCRFEAAVDSAPPSLAAEQLSDGRLVLSRFLALASGVLGVSRLARRVSIPKPTVHRLLGRSGRRGLRAPAPQPDVSSPITRRPWAMSVASRPSGDQRRFATGWNCPIGRRHLYVALHGRGWRHRGWPRPSRKGACVLRGRTPRLLPLWRTDAKRRDPSWRW
ncbi:helix-turn-helix domain-containing protein [Lentzea sp. E54]|uniref:helix-turn-helix domain-containing protein n=1 Tax=Lentzea xerophila TaxID=3435883 RepID=UPI003DA248C2